MLYIAIVTLLLTNNSISRIQAEETVEPRANGYRRKIPMDLVQQPFQYQLPGDGKDIILGSQTYQNGMTFNVDPVGPNMFGAYTNHVNQNFGFDGNQNQAQPNGGGIRYGSSTVQINNDYRNGKGARNSGGPRGYESRDSQPEINAPSEKKAQNSIESQAHSAKPNSSSKQFSLSFNNLFFYSLIVLFEKCVLE